MSPTVAPYVGAWIETRQNYPNKRPRQVAPYVGAWIETFSGLLAFCLVASHPTWVRGLKLGEDYIRQMKRESHPTWVRGLKLTKSFTGLHLAASHPTWVRGLKL